MDKNVIQSPVEAINTGSNVKTGGLGFSREVDLANFGYKKVGNLPQNPPFNGTATTKITIITDGFGNLKNLFPGYLDSLGR